MKSESGVHIAIFASGSGTNAQNMIEYFRDHSTIHINLIVSHRSNAYVLKRAENENVPYVVLSGNDWNENGKSFKSPSGIMKLISSYLPGIFALLPILADSAIPRAKL